MFYDFFLIGYMNGLHSFLHESEKWVHMSGRRIVSTNRWKTSLERARSGLAKGREGTELMLAGKYDEAEEMALASLEDVKQRYAYHVVRRHYLCSV